jgi:hypothetical protein
VVPTQVRVPAHVCARSSNGLAACRPSGYLVCVEQIRPFSDERWSAFCAFCGNTPDTRDHVPPRVFLDQPYPDNVPVVGACRDCNESASLDEAYVACLLEVAEHGTVSPAEVHRRKIARILGGKPLLAARLALSLKPGAKYSVTSEEKERISRVLEKIARALWAYETSEAAGLGSAAVRYAQVSQLSDVEFDNFRKLAEPDVFPEVGSRMMSRVIVAQAGIIPASWIEVQQGRFSYALEIARPRVKMILGDYLAAEVDLDQG